MAKEQIKKLHEWEIIANEISKKRNADVFLYTGNINDAKVDALIKLAKFPERKENVVLLLTTNGGSPDAAYRMTRCLQRQYTKIILYIYGTCKSAGTLVSVGAHEIILSDYGEFGPLDIQVEKPDELFDTISGLNITQALRSLDTRTQELFRSILIDLKAGSRGQLSTKLAAEIASNLAIGVYEKIFAQIDPNQLGSIERSVNIASDYGKRLRRNTDNVKDNTIDILVSGYPSHNFVIDIKEAKELFNNVRMPDEEEEKLAELIAHVCREAVTGDPIVEKLNKILENENESQKNKTDVEGANGAREGSDKDNSPTPAKAVTVS